VTLFSRPCCLRAKSMKLATTTPSKTVLPPPPTTLSGFAAVTPAPTHPSASTGVLPALPVSLRGEGVGGGRRCVGSESLPGPFVSCKTRDGALRRQLPAAVPRALYFPSLCLSVSPSLRLSVPLSLCLSFSLLCVTLPAIAPIHLPYRTGAAPGQHSLAHTVSPVAHFLFFSVQRRNSPSSSLQASTAKMLPTTR
jgi:hypothetical protein